MSLGFADGPQMRSMFRFLRKTGLSYLIVHLATRILKLMGNGFTLRRIKHLLIIGQSHLDIAWRWTRKQGILKTRATFKKALDHMDEVPEFSFAQPSPSYHFFMEKYFPEIFTRIKAAVRRGQWLPVGGMWVEPDCNLPSGESLVRQRLYGQRYYLEKFGRISDVEIIQDSFGFNWNLPQILAKSGAKLFITGKLFWNDTNTFPFGMLHWEGPDGTKLPTMHMHFGYLIPINMGKKYPGLWNLGKEGRELRATYATSDREIRAWRSDELMPAHIFGYGMGDGGHGPIEGEITIVKALARLYFRNMKWARGSDLANLFPPYYKRWATWVDEMYLEKHRGVYTSVSRAKLFNRTSENSLEDSEKIACLATFLNGNSPSTREFADVWKVVLLNQFHDVLPGSSIPEVYVDLDQDAAQVAQFTTSVIERALNYLSTNISLHNANAPVLLAFNPLSWPREGVVEVPRRILQDMADATQGANWCQNLDGKDTVLIRLPPVVPLGYQIFSLENDIAKIALDESLHYVEEEDYIHLENEYLSALINKQTGEIDRVVGKTTQFEGIGSGSNKIRLFAETGGKTDAWDISIGYKNYEIKLPREAESVRVTEEGPLRLTVEVLRKYRESTCIQRISLASGADILTCDMDLDWHEPEVLVKLCFNALVTTDIVSCEIPYAYIDRPVTPRTRFDKARWEYCGQKWVSVSDGARGVTITNNCKYGFNVEGQELRMSVLRTPKHVGYAKETVFVNRASDGGLDPAMPRYMDLGEHKHITYCVFLHAGNWRQGAWKKALEQNHPLILFPVIESSNGNFPAAISLATIDAENVEIGTVKFGEDKPLDEENFCLVFRLVERAGIPTTATMHVNDIMPIATVVETDLLERPTGSLAPDGNCFAVTLGPYEIKTIAVNFRRQLANHCT